MAAGNGSGRATHGQWADQVDGTCANPVLPGDFSDLDAIGVGRITWGSYRGDRIGVFTFNSLGETGYPGRG